MPEHSDSKSNEQKKAAADKAPAAETNALSETTISRRLSFSPPASYTPPPENKNDTLSDTRTAQLKAFTTSTSAGTKKDAETTIPEPFAPVQKKENKTGLPDQLKSGVESLSGFSMDDVKVHYNSPQPAQLQAHAFARGTDIHIAPGQEKHLAHEAWHVAQQKQDRVRPTIQAKNTPVNDDPALEKEADTMGEKASLYSAAGKNSVQLKQAIAVPEKVVQGNFKMLDAERINHIITKAKEQGEDLDPDYLEGLFEAADHDEDSPVLYFEVGKIDKSHLTKKESDYGIKKRLFVNARSLELAQAKEARLDEMRNLYDILRADVNIYTLQEEGPYKLGTIKANVSEALNDEHGSAKEEELIGNILTGGIEQPGGDSYGSIEFRFQKAKGVLQLTDEDGFAESAPILKLLERNPGISPNKVSKKILNIYQEVYQQSHMPHPEERMGKGFLFVEESIIETFMGTLKMAIESGELPDWEADIEVEHQNEDDVLPNAPIADNKDRSKTYDRRANRGNRGQGQAAVMDGWSAGNYVKHFNAHTDDLKWEWLHIQGARLGGPNSSTNLVAGTFAANTAMIPYERAVYNLSKLATVHKPVKVDWGATVKKDEEGAPTHIGDKITMAVSFPQGPPPIKDELDPVKLAKPFPVTFNAQEGDQVTKFERDITELRTGKTL